MIPALGAEGAAKLQKQMTEHTLANARKLKLSRSLNIQVYFAGGTKQLMEEWLGTDITYYPQAEGDLGKRMDSAIKNALVTEMKRVVTIGIDCPDINQSILNQAFSALKQKDLVLGPAADGGYYLIGVNRLIPELFKNINWGTETVLAETQTIANRLNLTVEYLPILRDVDRPEDLPVWEKFS
jgi:hypothetical protein